MPLYSIPVMLPYKVHTDEGAPVYSLHANTVASSKKTALTTAKALAKAMSILRTGELPRKISTERAKVGDIKGQIIGPYAYIFTRSQRIPHISFPPRLDSYSSQHLQDALKGLPDQSIHGLVFDCAPMISIDSTSMGILAQFASAKNIHFFRVPEPIMKILTLVGLHTILPIHSDIGSALDGMIHASNNNADSSAFP